MTTTTTDLNHAEWCKGERTERTEHPEQNIVTHHCIDCGAHQARDGKGATLPTRTVTGALATEGRGDYDVSLERATGAPRNSGTWPAHADGVQA